MNECAPPLTAGLNADGDFVPAKDMPTSAGQTCTTSIEQIHPLPKAKRTVKHRNTAKRN
jgi:hypothetical protein